MKDSMRSSVGTYLSDISDFLSREELSEMMASGRVKAVKKDVAVFEEGETADALYYIIEGTFSAVKQLGNDREVEIAERRTGEIFGEMGVVETENPVRSARVIAKEDGEILEICKASFDEAISNGSIWASKLVFLLSKVLSSRLREMSQEFAAQWEKSHTKPVNEVEAFGTHLTEKWDF